MPPKAVRKRGLGQVTKDHRRGTWRGRVQINGKRHSVTADTRGNAQAMLDELIDNGGRTMPLRSPRDSVTVGGALTEWVESPTRQKKAGQTVKGYKWGIAHLRPLWPVALADLTGEDVENLLEKVSTDLGASSMERVRSILAMSIDYAMKRRLPGYPTFNCARIVELPDSDIKRRPKRALGVDDALALIAVAQTDKQYGPLAVIPLYVACRPGEVAGLAWDAIDLHRGTLHVRQARRKEADGSMSMAAPKASSKRKLRMPPDLVEYLREHQTAQKRRFLKAGITWDPSALVVCTRTGNALEPNAVLRVIDRLCKDAKIERITPNELRHTAATLNAYNGMPFEELRFVMGHTTDRMLREIYVHVPDVIAADQLQGVYARAAAR